MLATLPETTARVSTEYPTAARRRAGRALPVLVAVAIPLLSLSTLLITGTARAAEAPPSSEDDPTFVTPPAQPTVVSVGAYLIGLSRVSEPAEPFPTYDVEMFLNIAWKDPRLAYGDQDSPPRVFQGEEAEEKLSEIWSPDIEIQNEVEQRRTESVELTLLPDGTVDYEERFGAMVHAQLDLHEFPFDRQSLDIEMQSFTWDRNEATFTTNDAQTGFDRDFKTPEWSVTGVEDFLDVRSEIRDDREFASYTFRIHAKRQFGHYLLRLLLPLVFVMVLTWCVFWEPTERRFEVGFIALLTVVAIHTVVGNSLPRLNYATIADVFLIVCYLVASALIVSSLVVRRIEDRGEVERARRIDRWMRYSLPVAAALILAVSVLLLWS